jgi:hypothetical protein
VTTILSGETTAAFELAQRNRIRAFRLGGYVLIVAEGDLPTPGYEVDIQQSPLRIFPQQYNLLRRERPGIWPDVVVPYRYGEVVRFPADQPRVTVHHADGQDAVDISSTATTWPSWRRCWTGRPAHWVSRRRAGPRGCHPG